MEKKEMKNTIRNRMKEDIIAILQEQASGVDDGFGGTHIVIFDHSFEDAAEDITKMIQASYVVNHPSRGGVGRKFEY